jgi:hypothetical protein
MKEFAFTLRPFVTVAQLLAYLLVLIRIFSSGLHKTYFWFTIYICYESVRLALVWFMPYGTNLYAYTYFLTQPITWCLYLLVILELYHLALKNHAGIATFARRALMVALAGSTLLSAVTFAFEAQQPDFNPIRTYLLIERMILSSLLILLLLFTAFLGYFPVPVNRNTVAHTRIFACYFLLRTILLIFRNLITGEAIYGVNLVLSLLATACLTSWALLLSRAGEEISTSTSYRSDPEAEERLIAQLDAINRTLLSSAKK